MQMQNKDLFIRVEFLIILLSVLICFYKLSDKIDEYAARSDKNYEIFNSIVKKAK